MITGRLVAKYGTTLIIDTMWYQPDEDFDGKYFDIVCDSHTAKNVWRSMKYQIVDFDQEKNRIRPNYAYEEFCIGVEVE